MKIGKSGTGHLILDRVPFEKTFSDGTPDPWANLKVTWTIETKRKK